MRRRLRLRRRFRILIEIGFYSKIVIRSPRARRVISPRPIRRPAAGLDVGIDDYYIWAGNKYTYTVDMILLLI